MKNNNHIQRRTSRRLTVALLLVALVYTLSACSAKERDADKNTKVSDSASEITETETTTTETTASETAEAPAPTSTSETSATEPSETETVPEDTTETTPEVTEATPTPTPKPKPTKAPKPTPVPATPTPVPPTATPTPKPKPTASSSDAQTVLNKVNEERAKKGAAPLVLDSSLNKAAQVRAAELARSYGHTRPNGTSCTTAITDQGLSYSCVGENISAGYESSSAAADGWISSSNHYENIVNPNYTKMGFAKIVVSGEDDPQGYKTYYVQIFIG